MSIDPNMQKWIVASTAKYFDDHKGSTFLYIEGDDTTILPQQTAWAELRIHSIQLMEVAQDDIYYEFGLNIMCSVKDPTSYALELLVGFYQNLLFGEIPVFKFGGDESLVGCFRLKFRTKVDTINWGLVQIDLNGPLRVMQASLDATFELRQ